MRSGARVTVGLRVVGLTFWVRSRFGVWVGVEVRVGFGVRVGVGMGVV